MCKGRIWSPPYPWCHFWSATELGRKMQRREAWKVNHQRDVLHACLSLWFPGDLAEQMLGSSLSSTWRVSLAKEAPVGGLPQAVWGSWDGEVPQIIWVKQLWPCASDFLNVLLDLDWWGSSLWMGNEMRSSSKTFNEVLCCSLIRIYFKPSFASLPSLGSNFFWASLTQGAPPSPESSPGHSCCPQQGCECSAGFWG